MSALWLKFCRKRSFLAKRVYDPCKFIGGIHVIVAASAHVKCFVYVQAFVLDIIPPLALSSVVLCYINVNSFPAVNNWNIMFSACF